MFRSSDVCSAPGMDLNSVVWDAELEQLLSSMPDYSIKTEDAVEPHTQMSDRIFQCPEQQTWLSSPESGSSPSPSLPSTPFGPPSSATMATSAAAAVAASNLPQIEPFQIKCESSPSTSSSSNVAVSAILFHKPRGSQGAWVPIPPNAHIRCVTLSGLFGGKCHHSLAIFTFLVTILLAKNKPNRVTKGKGKKLRMVVRCTQLFSPQDLNLWLIDEEEGTTNQQGFSVDTNKTSLEVPMSTNICSKRRGPNSEPFFLISGLLATRRSRLGSVWRRLRLT